jgi:hypothetical protein
MNRAAYTGYSTEVEPFAADPQAGSLNGDQACSINTLWLKFQSVSTGL